MPTATGLADTVCTEIATAVNAMNKLDSEITATADFCPELDFSTIKTQICRVVPQNYSCNGSTRGSNQVEVTANVVICKKIAVSDLKANVIVAEDIAKGLERKALAHGVIKGIQMSPLYDIDLVKEKRIFLSNILVTVFVSPRV